MNILVLGQSIPGLMAALRLLQEGHKVTILGKADARSSIGIGSTYLWRTPDMVEYMKDVGIPEDWIDDNSETTRVKFAAPCLGSPTQFTLHSRSPLLQRSYFAKTGSKNPPCKGLAQFEVIRGGLERLRAKLLDHLVCKSNPATWINGHAIWIHEGHTVVANRIDAEGESSEVINRYDGVVNTLPRGLFERLRGHDIGPCSKDVNFYFSDTNYYGTLSGLDADTFNCMIYDGNPTIPWYRVARNEEGTFVYESFNSMDSFTWKSMIRLPGKIVKPELTPPSVPGVFHLGRWATLDEELLISDMPSALNFINFD